MFQSRVFHKLPTQQIYQNLLTFLARIHIKIHFILNKVRKNGNKKKEKHKRQTNRSLKGVKVVYKMFDSVLEALSVR